MKYQLIEFPGGWFGIRKKSFLGNVMYWDFAFGGFLYPAEGHLPYPQCRTGRERALAHLNEMVNPAKVIEVFKK